MTYLLTGATGFVGKHIVDLLLTQGHGVNYLGRRRSKHLDSRASFYEWGSSEKQPPLDAMGRIDAVIHLAGEPVAQRWNAEVKKRIYDSRVHGTANLVAALVRCRHKPAVLVSASAMGYYGDRGDELLNEASSPGSDFLANVCVQWEKAAHLAESEGLRVSSIRIPIVLGREGGALPAMVRPFRFGVGGKLNGGQQWMSWIHVQDLARLFIWTTETTSVKGALNGGTDNPVRNAEWTQILASVLHRPAFFTVPSFALKLALGEVAESAIQSIRLAPSAAESHGFRFEFSELKQALAALLGGRQETAPT